MSIKSPLGRVLGLGSAREGTGHWWAQRTSAVALVPLMLWFAASMAGAAGYDYETLAYWLSKPVNAILVILLCVSLLYHAKLGLQVVIEDYVQGGSRMLWLIVVNFLCIGLAVAAIFAVVSVSLG